MTSENVYRMFRHGDEIPAHLQADADQAAAAIRGNINWLINRDIRDHLSVEHQCQAFCFPDASVDMVFHQMPPDQVAFVALVAVRLLAKAYLRDNPGLLEEE